MGLFWRFSGPQPLAVKGVTCGAELCPVIQTGSPSRNRSVDVQVSDDRRAAAGYPSDRHYPPVHRSCRRRAHLVGRKTWVHPIEWQRAKGFRGQVQGYLPHRWPQWWDPEPLRFESFAFGPFRERMSLTKRGDVFVVPTPGHTPGHVSVVVRGAPSIFIAGDTSYTQELLEQGVVDGVSPDEDVARQTNQRIQAVAREEPLVYLPSHDPGSAERLARLETLTSVAA